MSIASNDPTESIDADAEAEEDEKKTRKVGKEQAERNKEDDPPA